MVITMCDLLNAFSPINKRCPLQPPEQIWQPLEKAELSKESGGYIFLGLLDAQESLKGSLFILVTTPLIPLIRYISAHYQAPLPIPLNQPQVWEAPYGRSAFLRPVRPVVQVLVICWFSRLTLSDPSAPDCGDILPYHFRQHGSLS